MLNNFLVPFFFTALAHSSGTRLYPLHTHSSRVLQNKNMFPLHQAEWHSTFDITFIIFFFCSHCYLCMTRIASHKLGVPMPDLPDELGCDAAGGCVACAPFLGRKIWKLNHSADVRCIRLPLPLSAECKSYAHLCFHWIIIMSAVDVLFDWNLMMCRIWAISAYTMHN